MTITAICVAVAVLASNVILFSRFVDTSFENSLEWATLEILNEISVLENNAAHLAAIYFAGDSELIYAIEADDGEGLRKRAEELFHEIGIEIFTVTDIHGRSIAQPHSPDFAGFYLMTMHSVRHALINEAPITTVEGGSTANLMVSAASPIFGTQNNVIGAVLVGFRLDTDAFVDRRRNIAGAEIAFFRGFESISSTLKDERGSRAIGMALPDVVHHNVVINGTVFTGDLVLLGQDMTARFTPIFDTYGNVVATLFVGHYLAEKTSVIQSFILTGVLITTTLLIISTLSTYIISKKIANPISHKLDQLYVDALTGINNRRYFDDNFYKLIENLSRSNDVLSLAIIDIDFFKYYNDAYGHGAGDECLKIVANALSKSVMRSNDFVARYGGEEFVAVFPSTSSDGAHIVAQRLVESVRSCDIPHKDSKISNRVTISVGIATASVKDLENAAAIVEFADHLLYKSKQDGRNRYTHGSLPDV